MSIEALRTIDLSQFPTDTKLETWEDFFDIGKKAHLVLKTAFLDVLDDEEHGSPLTKVTPYWRDDPRLSFYYGFVAVVFARERLNKELNQIRQKITKRKDNILGVALQLALEGRTDLVLQNLQKRKSDSPEVAIIQTVSMLEELAQKAKNSDKLDQGQVQEYLPQVATTLVNLIGRDFILRLPDTIARARSIELPPEPEEPDLAQDRLDLMRALSRKRGYRNPHGGETIFDWRHFFEDKNPVAIALLGSPLATFLEDSPSAQMINSRHKTEEEQFSFALRLAKSVVEAQINKDSRIRSAIGKVKTGGRPDEIEKAIRGKPDSPEVKAARAIILLVDALSQWTRLFHQEIINDNIDPAASLIMDLITEQDIKRALGIKEPRASQPS